MIDSRLKELKFSKEELIAGIKREVSKVNKYYKNEQEPVIILGILKGCANFLGAILTKFKFETQLEIIKTSITNGANTKNYVTFEHNLKTKIKGKKILIVEDIIDSAKTLTSTIKKLKNKKAKEIKVITLLNKVHGRKIKFTPDWKIVESSSKDWLVGWGLDINEWGRRFSYIASIKKETKNKKNGE